MNINPHTGARLHSKANTKEYEDNYDRIFGKKSEDNCSSLDAAYERKAMKEGVVTKPIFSENQLEFDFENNSN